MHLSPISYLAFGLAAMPLAAAATTGLFPKIAGGEPVPSNALNYVAFIQAVEGSSGSSCTGSLIAPNIVLTAGHCIYRNSSQVYSAQEFQVGFTHRMPDLSKKYKGYDVSKIVLPSTFNIASLNTDIALLVLRENVPASVATPVQLYSGDYYTDTPLVAAGFGMTNATGGGSTPASLMMVKLNVGSDDFCKQNTAAFSHTYNICTDGKAGKDTCKGDSGGPLLAPVNHGNNSYALIGITSYTPINANNPSGLCAQLNGTGVYTRVAPYISWIAQFSNLNASDISITNITNNAASATVSATQTLNSELGSLLPESTYIWLSGDSSEPFLTATTEYVDSSPSIIIATFPSSSKSAAMSTSVCLANIIVVLGAAVAVLLSLG
ncbi:hypothetical protein GGI04_001381 [Coemansia thaxteri]|nr:hypothetical protein GGI04_001381 [Coemansia thaxteri]